MQMQDLNKNQIVLLVLLISFVTSIATGIMTVTLLQEAPVEVTRNINSVVEKTIETVTKPVTTLVPSGQKEVTTVIVKEEDSIINSIDQNIKSIVRINEIDGSSGDSSFYGIGLVASKDGFIIADKKTILANNTYRATMSDGTNFDLAAQGLDKQTNFVLFKAIQPQKTTTYPFIPATFSDTEPKLGQTLISLGGDTNNSVGVGRVVSLDTKDVAVGTTTTKVLSSINTDISLKDFVDGSPAFNLSGEVVGVELSLDNSKSFTPVVVLEKELSLLEVSLKTP